MIAACEHQRHGDRLAVEIKAQNEISLRIGKRRDDVADEGCAFRRFEKGRAAPPFPALAFEGQKIFRAGLDLLRRAKNAQRDCAASFEELAGAP